MLKTVVLLMGLFICSSLILTSLAIEEPTTKVSVEVLDYTGSHVSHAFVHDSIGIMKGYTNSRGLFNVVAKLSGSLIADRICAVYKYPNGKTAEGCVSTHLSDELSVDQIEIKLRAPK